MKKFFLAAIAIMFLVGCGGKKQEPSPAPAAVVEKYDPAKDKNFVAAVDAAVAKKVPVEVISALKKIEAEKIRRAEEDEEARQDSIAEAKAERAAKELAATPGKVRRLEKELAEIKAKLAAQPLIIPSSAAQAEEPVVLQPQQATNLPVVASTTGTAKTFEVKVEASQPIQKFGLTIQGWTEYKPGQVISLAPGEYSVNAQGTSGVWAVDKNSISVEKPNFELKVNGIVVTVNGGYDNGVQGANSRFRLNPDGSVTPL